MKIGKKMRSLYLELKKQVINKHIKRVLLQGEKIHLRVIMTRF